MNAPHDDHRLVRRARAVAGAAALVAASAVASACGSTAAGGADASTSDGSAADARVETDAPSPADAAAEAGFAYRIVAGDCRLLWEVHGSADTPWLGRTVVAVGDVDGDGRRDVAVQGGTAREDSSATIELLSGATGAQIRRFELPRVDGRVFDVGDLDGDGVHELAFRLDTGGSSIEADGGSSSMPTPPGERTVRAVSVRTGATLWERVGPLGEPDFGAHPRPAPAPPGSGRHGDVLVASYGTSAPPTPRTARLHLLSGADGTTLRTVTPPADASEIFGNATMPADLDGDGHVDLVVGDAFAFGFTGALFAMSGADGDVLWTVRGTVLDTEADLLGGVYVPAGDLDGDGVIDFAIGVHNSADASRNEAIGRVQLVGGVDGRDRWVRGGRRWGEHFGASIARAGDVDGDGASDLVVGAPMPGLPAIVPGAGGRVAVLSGADGAVLFDVESIVGARDRSDELGTSVDALGDVTGEGGAEFVAGAPRAQIAGAGGPGVVTAWTCDARM